MTMTLSVKEKFLWMYSRVLVAATFLLLVAGGLVTSHEAGLAVPDWPTSYGQWFPPMVGNVFWEHGHRMIAASIGLLTLIFAFLIQKMESRPWLKRLVWIALGMVILQGLLGGLTVILMLPPPVSILHACLAQTFFCVTIALSYFLNPNSAAYSLSQVEGIPRLKRLAMLTAGFAYIQLILGAAIRHTAFTVIPHIVMAFLILLHVAFVANRVMHLPENRGTLQNNAIALGIITVIQFFLGIGSYVFTRMMERGYAPSQGEVIFTAAHQSLGALVLGLLVLIVLKVSR